MKVGREILIEEVGRIQPPTGRRVAAQAGRTPSEKSYLPRRGV